MNSSVFREIFIFSQLIQYSRWQTTPKNISIYIPDDLVERMDKYKEVNWSEIARQSIEDYIENRKRYEQYKTALEKDMNELKYMRNEIAHNINKFMPMYKEISMEQVISITTNFELTPNNKYPNIKLNVKNISNEAIILDRILLNIYLKDINNSDIDIIPAYYMEIIKINIQEEKEINVPLILTEEIRNNITNILNRFKEDINIVINTKAYIEKENKIYLSNKYDKQMKSYNQWNKWLNSPTFTEEKTV